MVVRKSLTVPAPYETTSSFLKAQKFASEYSGMFSEPKGMQGR